MTHSDLTSDAVAFIDAWLSEHAFWADPRTIDFALDVRAILADPAELDEELEAETTATVGAKGS